MNNIFDDIRADQRRNEIGLCEHLWVLRDDGNSLYCYECKVEKVLEKEEK